MARMKNETAAGRKVDSKAPPLISDEKLRLLYVTMLKCRMLQKRVGAALQGTESAGMHLTALGGEAVAVATTIDLRTKDAVAPSPGDFITAFTNGLCLQTIFRDVRDFADGRDMGRSALGRFEGKIFRIIPPTLTAVAQLTIATGVALASKTTKCFDVVVVDRQAKQPWLELELEVLQFAVEKALPLILVSRTNPAAGSSDLSCESGVPQIGVPVIAVDGNDVVAVYRVAQEAFARARRGQGPTWIECTTCLQGHSQVLEPEGLERWKEKDPILKMEQYLSARALYVEEWKYALIAGFSRELEAAIEVSLH